MPVLTNDLTHTQTDGHPRQGTIASSCSPSLVSVVWKALLLWLSSSVLRFCHHWTPSLPVAQTQEAMNSLLFHNKSSASVSQYAKCRVLLQFFVFFNQGIILYLNFRCTRYTRELVFNGKMMVLLCVHYTRHYTVSMKAITLVSRQSGSKLLCRVRWRRAAEG